MLLTPSTVSINLSTGVITPSDPVSARKTLAITLTGTGSANVDNQRAALYRLNRNGIDGVLCATCNAFTGPANAFVGTMSLNTAQVVQAFTDIVAVRQYETLIFSILLYDAASTIYTVWDDLPVAYEFALAAGTPPNVDPLSGGTTIWGNLKLEGGTLWMMNLDTGKYDPLTARGDDSAEADQQHLNLGPGETI